MEPIIPAMGFLTLIVMFLGIVLAILWTLLPFAVFGIKNRLDKLINQIEILNSKISKIENILSKSSELQILNTSSEKNNHEKYMPQK